MEPTTRAGRPAAAVAWTAAAVALAAAVGTAWLGVADSAPTGEPASLKPILLTAVWVVPGVLLTLARPRLALGWLALGEALLFAAAGLAEQWVRTGTGVGTDVAWAAWVSDRFSAFLAVGVWLVLILLPDGRLPGRGWRPVVGAILTVQCLALAAFVTVRGPAAGPDSSLPGSARAVANPVGLLPPEVGTWLAGLDTVLLQVPLLLCLVAYVLRLRRAGPDERVRVVGVLLAASTFVLLVVLGHAWLPQLSDALDVLAAALLAVQLTTAVLGRRPHVVAILVCQAFVHTVLIACVAGLAVAVTALLELLGRDLPTVGVAAVAGAAALAVQPLRSRLTRLVDRLLHGDLRDPYRALQRLAERTHRAPTADAVLEGLAASVAASLRVPWACARAGGHTGEWGTRPADGSEENAELVSGATPVGTLTVGPGSGRRLHTEEVRLLADLGRHGGVAVQAVLLTDELRAGRAGLVLAREEERRRLRRDLHDDVGPTLAGLTMQLGIVRTLVRSQPDASADRLALLQDAARRALESVRRVVHGLRPPALDDLGLVGALRQLADSLGLRARFPDDDPLRLPAAVEVAGYRIAAEALHNVARHAGTDEVEVSLRIDGGDLVLRVRDDGAGIDPDRRAGVGSIAMQERVDELEGSLRIESAPGRGTTVEARLPAAAYGESVHDEQVPA
jgi:signal transduction histidine kinase